MGFIRKLLKLKIYMRTGGPKMTLKVANVESKSVSIELSEVSGDLALVKFHLLQGCLPATNSNYLGIWPAVEAVKGAAIPWDSAPSKTKKIQTDSEDSSVTMTHLDLTQGSYIIGYSVSAYQEVKPVNNFCASAFIPKLGQGVTYEYLSVNLSIRTILPKSIIIDYTTLPNYRPDHYNNWIGIWDITTDIYKDNPISYVQIESDMSKDYVALDDFTGISGHRYVAAYFMDGWSREVVNLSRRGIAATTYFDTVES